MYAEFTWMDGSAAGFSHQICWDQDPSEILRGGKNEKRECDTAVWAMAGVWHHPEEHFLTELETS